MPGPYGPGRSGEGNEPVKYVVVTGSKAGGVAPVHMISAWCDSQRLVLGQRPSASKGNEIRDIPELLELLQLEGATITTAWGASAPLRKRSATGGGPPVRTEANQGTLHGDVLLWFGSGSTKMSNITGRLTGTGAGRDT